MEVFLDDERIFDKLGEGNIFPDLARIPEMKQVIAAKIWPVWKMLEKRNSTRIIEITIPIRGPYFVLMALGQAC